MHVELADHRRGRAAYECHFVAVADQHLGPRISSTAENATCRIPNSEERAPPEHGSSQ